MEFILSDVTEMLGVNFETFFWTINFDLSYQRGTFFKFHNEENKAAQYKIKMFHHFQKFSSFQFEFQRKTKVKKLGKPIKNIW